MDFDDFCEYFDIETESDSTSLSGWIMEQCYEAIAAHPGMTVVVMVLAMCVSFLLSVRLYER